MAITLATFLPQAAKLPTSNRASLGTRNGIPILTYPDLVDTASIWTGVMPASAGLTGTLSVLVRFVSTATAGNAVVGASIERDDSGTDLDADSFATEQTTTQAASATSGKPATATISLTSSQYDSVAAGEQFRLKIRVLGSSGSHTIGAAVQIMSVMIQEPGSASGSGSSGISNYCYLEKSGNQSVNSSSFDVVLWDTEPQDTDAFHSTVSNTGRITVPSGLDGVYSLEASILFSANATGVRQVYLYHVDSGGSAYRRSQTIVAPGTATVAALCVTMGPTRAIAGDYFYIEVYHEAGTAVNVVGTSTSSHFSAIKIAS